MTMTESQSDYRLRLILERTMEAIEGGAEQRTAIWTAIVTTDEYARLDSAVTKDAGEHAYTNLTREEMEKAIWPVASRRLAPPKLQPKRKFWKEEGPKWWKLDQ